MYGLKFEDTAQGQIPCLALGRPWDSFQLPGSDTKKKQKKAGVIVQWLSRN